MINTEPKGSFVSVVLWSISAVFVVEAIIAVIHKFDVGSLQMTHIHVFVGRSVVVFIFRYVLCKLQ